MTLQNVKITLRIDNLQNWQNANPTLSNGELILVNDTINDIIKFKVGNGISAFNELPYIGQKYIATDFMDAIYTHAQKFSQGVRNEVSSISFASGTFLQANANFSQVLGINAQSKNTDDYSFVWSGDDTTALGTGSYTSHGKGTFSLNPINGLSGIYIGEKTLADTITNISVDGKKTIDLQIINISQDDYHLLVKSGNTLSNALYIVSSDMMNMYNERIINLADGISANDAVNLNQLCSAISSIDIPEIPTKVSVFENDANYTKLSVDQIPTTSFNVKHVSQDEYHTEVINGTDPNTLYIVSSDSLNMYGEAIQNLADPISATDAVNKQYVDSISTYLSNDYEQKINSNYESFNNKLNAISNIVDNKITIDGISSDSVDIKHIAQEEYHELVANNNVLSNTLYIVSSDALNMYGERIENVADGIYANDAVNLNQLCSAISSIDIPNKLSEFENDTNFGKIFIDDNSSLSLNIKNISRKDYYELVAASAVLSNTIYIISSDALNMYGEQIKNLANGEISSDAANLGQVSTLIEIEKNRAVDSENSILHTLSETNNELNNKIDNKVLIDGLSAEKFEVKHISQNDYYALVKDNNVLSNVIYVVSSDEMNMYNERIINVADAISSNDAVNLNQLCSAISSIDIPEIPTKVSVFENDANYTKLSVDNNSTSKFGIEHISQDDYHKLVVDKTIDNNKLYIVSSDNINAYGEKIINVAEPENENDATTKKYVDEKTNEISSKSAVYIGDQVSNLKIVHLSQDDYYDLVVNNQTETSVLYIISSENLNVYNEKITNVLSGEDDTDATNVGQVKQYINELSNSLVTNDNIISTKISEKIVIDDINEEQLNIKHISQDDYHVLVKDNNVLSNTLYIVSSDTLNMYGERIENVANGISANDAATYGQLSVVENKVETLIHDIQIIKPVYNGKLHLQLTAYINQEMTDIVITSNSLIDQKYFAAFLNTSDEQKWIQIENTGIGSEFNNCPVLVKLTDILTDNNQSNKYSKLFICYEWYNLGDDGIKHISDRYSMVVPSHTEVGANSTDYIVTSQFEELASNVRKDSCIVDLEDDKYRCYPYKTNIISNSLTGIVPLILDNYQLNKQYDICFSTGDSKTILEFYYENGINGIEIDDSWNINKNYKFEPNKSYLIKVRQDLIEVVENKYDGSSSSGNHSYKLVTAELSGTTSLSCNIEDRTITTVVVSDSEIPVTVNFPQKIDGYARDFILRIEVTSSEAPEFIFAGLDDSWSVDSEDDEWMFMQPGINVISFTEMK